MKRRRGGLPTFSYHLVCGSSAGQSADADAGSVAQTHELCAPWSARWFCGGVSEPAPSSPCTASSALEQSPSVALTPPLSEPPILKTGDGGPTEKEDKSEQEKGLTDWTKFNCQCKFNCIEIFWIYSTYIYIHISTHGVAVVFNNCLVAEIIISCNGCIEVMNITT